MKLIFADKDIPKLWECIKGKTYTELSYYETLCVKSNTDKFVRLGYIELPVNVKKQLWEQTAHITDAEQRKELYSVLIYKEYIRNESNRK